MRYCDLYSGVHNTYIFVDKTVVQSLISQEKLPSILYFSNAWILKLDVTWQDKIYRPA